MDGPTTQRRSATARADQAPSRTKVSSSKSPGSTAHKSRPPLIGPADPNEYDASMQPGYTAYQSGPPLNSSIWRLATVRRTD